MTSWPMELTHEVTPDDCGPSGRIAEDALVRVLSHARRAYLRALGPEVADLPVRAWDLRVKILRPVQVGDRLVVRAQIDEIRQRSFRMRYLVFDGRTDAFAAEGSSMLVPLGPNGQDRDVPAALLAAAEAAEGRRFAEES